MGSRSRSQGSNIWTTTGGRADRLRPRALERFDDVLELDLVGEGDLDPRVRYPNDGPGDHLDSRAGAFRQGGVDAARLARLGPRTRPTRGPLGRPHGQALADDLARERTSLVVSGDGEDRAGVALGDEAALEQPDNVLG